MTLVRVTHGAGSQDDQRVRRRGVKRRDGERSALLVTEDATFRLPGERELPTGEAGASAFAAKHAESDGRKPRVELVDAMRQPDDRWVASLRLSSREVASGEMMYEMTVGGVFTVDGDRISAMQAFPSYAIADSPVGLAAWLLDHGDGGGQPAAGLVSGLTRTESDTGELTRDEILDNVTLYVNTLVRSGARAFPQRLSRRRAVAARLGAVQRLRGTTRRSLRRPSS